MCDHLVFAMWRRSTGQLPQNLARIQLDAARQTTHGEDPTGCCHCAPLTRAQQGAATTLARVQQDAAKAKPCLRNGETVRGSCGCCTWRKVQLDVSPQHWRASNGMLPIRRGSNRMLSVYDPSTKKCACADHLVPNPMGQKRSSRVGGKKANLELDREYVQICQIISRQIQTISSYF